MYFEILQNLFLKLLYSGFKKEINQLTIKDMGLSDKFQERKISDSKHILVHAKKCILNRQNQFLI